MWLIEGRTDRQLFYYNIDVNTSQLSDAQKGRMYEEFDDKDWLIDYSNRLLDCPKGGSSNPGVLNRGPLGPQEVPILFSVDPIVQQYAIKVTKRGPSRSPVDPGWEPLM